MNTKRYILAIDEGTASVRVSLFDTQQNKFIAKERAGIGQIYPQPGWVEQDAEEIWRHVQTKLNKVLRMVDLSEVWGIGITNQRETVVAWDAQTGKPVCNAIGWQCRRTVDFCKRELKGRVGKKIFLKTGLVPDAYFSATKIAWILKNNRQAQTLLKKGRLRVGTMESFLTFKMTQGKAFVTDAVNASRTMLLNLKTQNWDAELLRLFDIDRAILPDIVANDQVVGSYSFNGVEIPIAGLIGDQQSSLFGQACFHKGDIKNTFGTGSFMLLNIGEDIIYSKNKILTTLAWKIGGQATFALEGSVFSCGSSIDWMRNNLNFFSEMPELDALIASTKASNSLYFVPAFTGLGAPYWDGNARALLFGICRNTNKADVARAVLESIVFSVKEVYDIILKDAKVTICNIRVDGGVSQNDFLMQQQSDLLCHNIECAGEKESTSLGAIYLCGLALGVWKNLEEISKIYQAKRVFKPNKKNRIAIQQQYKNWQDAVQRSLSR